MIAAIVLAGRRNEGALREEAPEIGWEALVPVAGRPLAAHVIAALAATADMERVVVAGPEELGEAGAVVVPPGTRVSDSLRSALGALPDLNGDDELLLAAGDAPLLRPETVDALVGHCRGRGLHFGYPVVPRAVCQAAFPGMRRTYVRLREGAFTGGNCFYLRGSAVSAALALLERVHAERKRPLRLARMLGWGTVAGLLLGVARLRDVEAAGSRLLGAPAGAWVSPDAGVGVDVDGPDDLRRCRRSLGERA